MDFAGATMSLLLAGSPAPVLPAFEHPPFAAVAAAQESAAPAVAQVVVPQEDQSGDVVVTARDGRGDPAAPFNEAALDVAEAVDGALVGPVALAYEKHVPGPLRSGLRNFLTNLREPVVAFNYLLQFKVGKAAETAGRFLLNTTVGVVGLIDIARRKPFRLPLRRNSFANTLGFHGIGPGPFFFLPLVGPTTLRDLLGTVADQLLVPVQPIRVSSSLAYTLPIGVLSALDYRARIDPDLKRQRATRDPYTALRSEYLARRKAEIDALRGKLPVPPTPAP